MQQPGGLLCIDLEAFQSNTETAEKLTTCLETCSTSSSGRELSNELGPHRPVTNHMAQLSNELGPRVSTHVHPNKASKQGLVNELRSTELAHDLVGARTGDMYDVLWDLML